MAMIVDAHAQFGPSLDQAGVPFGALWPLAEARQLIELMDQAGIDRSVAFAPTWRGGDTFFDPEYERANDAIFQGVTEYPDRLIGFARVAPRYGARAVHELDRCFQQYGAVGLALDPEADAFSAMDRRLMTPLMERCAEHGAVVLFRCGFPPAQPGPVLTLAEAYPTVKFIIGHMGLRIGTDAASMARRYPNIYLETSLQTTSVLNAVLGSFDLDRLCFGSFAPFSIPLAEVRKIIALPRISPEQQEAILGGNLARMLNLTAPVDIGTKHQ